MSELTLENYTHRRTYPEKGSDWKISCRSSDVPLHAGSAYRLQWRLWSPMVVRNQRQNLPVLIHEHCEKYTNNCPDPPSYVPEWDVLHPECQLPPDALCVWVKAARQVSTSRSTAVPTMRVFFMMTPSSTITQSPSPGKTHETCWNSDPSNQIYKSTRHEKSIETLILWYITFPPILYLIAPTVAGNK